MDLLVTHPRMALLAAIVVIVFWYRWHINRHPWMPCLSCKGGGETTNILNPYGPCGRCGGTGRRRRFAATVLRRDPATGRKR